MQIKGAYILAVKLMLTHWTPILIMYLYKHTRMSIQITKSPNETAIKISDTV